MNKKNILLYLSFGFAIVGSIVVMIIHKNPISTIIDTVASLGTIIVVILTYKQFKIFNEEYKTKHQPKVIPYIDVIENTYQSALVYIKVYNETNVVAQNIGITINDEWLKILSEAEYKHTDIIREVGIRKNLYITNKQEHSYFLGNINEKERINKGTIIITITYYEKDVKEENLRKEDFVIDLRNILLKKESIYLANHLKNLDKKLLEEKKVEPQFKNAPSLV